MKISQRLSELFSGHDLATEISKDNNSIKNEDGFTVLHLCTSSDYAVYLSQALRKYLKDFQIFQRGKRLSKMKVELCF